MELSHKQARHGTIRAVRLERASSTARKRRARKFGKPIGIRMFTKGRLTGRMTAVLSALCLLLATEAWGRQGTGGADAVASAIRITKGNVARYRKLLPEPIYRRTALGQYAFTVVPVDAKRFRANYTDRFWAASAANRGKYAIDEKTGGLTDAATGAIPRRAFGLPFPVIDPDDPQSGTKIMHNYRLRKTQADGSSHEFYLADVTVEGEVLRSVKIFVSQRYYFGTSAPAPAEMPDNTSWRQLAAAREPKDVEGVGVLTWRFHDWTTWDRVWAFLPNIRRVRRIRSSSRGDRIPGFEVHGDDADCYDGKVTYFHWKLLRAGEVIGPLGGESPYAHVLRRESASRWSMELPYNNAVYETPHAKGAGWFTLRNVFVRRPVWIVEGTPRDPYYDVGKIVLYIDRDLYHAYYKIGFTKAGEQYQTSLCGLAWGRTPDGRFAAPTALLMTGINEKENRGTPAGRFTHETFERAFAEDWFTPESLAKLSRR